MWRGTRPIALDTRVHEPACFLQTMLIIDLVCSLGLGLVMPIELLFTSHSLDAQDCATLLFPKLDRHCAGPSFRIDRPGFSHGLPGRHHLLLRRGHAGDLPASGGGPTGRSPILRQDVRSAQHSRIHGLYFEPARLLLRTGRPPSPYSSCPWLHRPGAVGLPMVPDHQDRWQALEDKAGRNIDCSGSRTS